MKSADAGDENSVPVSGWCVEGTEDLMESSVEKLIKSTKIEPEAYDLDALVEKAFTGTRVTLT